MLFFILILFIMVATIYYTDKEGFEVGFLTFITVLVISATIFIPTIIFSTDVEVSRTYHKSKIYSFTVGNSNGFILRSNSQYFYYVKDVDGYYNWMTVDKERANLKEVEVSDGFEPYVLDSIVHFRLSYWIAPFSSRDGKAKLDIYIPKGSVIQQYHPN